MSQKIGNSEQELISTRRTCNPNLQLRLLVEDAENYANMFKAIAHPVRLQMFDLISQGEGEVCACDIERHFELTQPTISHHLKILRDAGLISSESRGVWVHHKVNAEKLDTLRHLLAMMQKQG